MTTIYQPTEHEGDCCPCVIDQFAFANETRASVRHCIERLLVRGWTQGEIARRLNATTSQVSRWKNKGMLPKTTTRASLFALEDEPAPRSMDEVILTIMREDAIGDTYDKGKMHLNRRSGFSRGGLDSVLRRLTEQGLIRELPREATRPRQWEVGHP